MRKLDLNYDKTFYTNIDELGLITSGLRALQDRISEMAVYQNEEGQRLYDQIDELIEYICEEL